MIRRQWDFSPAAPPLFLAGALFFVFASCIAASEKAQPQLQSREFFITSMGGAKISVKAELARSVEERMSGLMFRTKLLDGQGMFFIFPNDRVLSFWMKNTLIPLSIAFIAKDGTIAEIHDMEPGQLRSVQSGRSLRYALEVPQGWFKRANIVVGDKINTDGSL
ncbi:MAG: DUF192 domain-containing protein [Spirochaetaceae bacterium]|jgi:uncharacterized membrane protein (UPF0127 family)|nr:DUF192 domain-containing protein [Spirochaetaceae bacterium]